MERAAKRESNPKLEIGLPNRHGKRIRVMIKNTGCSVATGCYGKITIEHEIKDVHDPTDRIRTFITSDDYDQVERMNVNWAKGDVYELKIPKGNYEALQIAEVIETPDFSFAFNIASEEGFGEPAPPELSENAQVPPPLRRSRVVLKPGKYQGTLYVGADDVDEIEKNFELGLAYNEPYLLFT